MQRAQVFVQKQSHMLGANMKALPEVASPSPTFHLTVWAHPTVARLSESGTQSSELDHEAHAAWLMNTDPQLHGTPRIEHALWFSSDPSAGSAAEVPLLKWLQPSSCSKTHKAHCVAADSLITQTNTQPTDDMGLLA